MSDEYDGSIRMGTQALVSGRLDQALAHFVAAAERSTTQEEQADAVHRLGVVSWRRGERERSANEFQKAVDLRRSGEPLMLAESLNSLGAVLLELQIPERSVACLHEALELRTRHAGPQAPETITTLNNLAVVFQRAGRLLEARETLRRALLPMVAARGPMHQRVAGLLNNLGGIDEQLGKLEDAETHYSEAVRILRHTVGSVARETQIAEGNLARVRAIKE